MKMFMAIMCEWIVQARKLITNQRLALLRLLLCSQMKRTVWPLLLNKTQQDWQEDGTTCSLMESHSFGSMGGVCRSTTGLQMGNLAHFFHNPCSFRLCFEHACFTRLGLYLKANGCPSLVFFESCEPLLSAGNFQVMVHAWR